MDMNVVSELSSVDGFCEDGSELLCFIKTWSS
jgi:hypothetical protein